MKMSRKCKVEELAKRTPESLAKSLIEARDKVVNLEGQMRDLRLRESGAQRRAKEARDEAHYLSKVNEAMAKVLRKNGIAPMELIIRRIVKTCPSTCPERSDCEISMMCSDYAIDEDDIGGENCPEKKLAEETSTFEFYCFSVCGGELEGIDEDFDNTFKDGVFQVIDKKTMKTIYAGVTEDDLEEEGKEEEQADD